ncbi:MAG: tetratricopeptide repeat protein [Bacteroidia bacterium]
MKSTSLSLLLTFTLCVLLAYSQSSYNDGWEALNNADFLKAKTSFEKAVKESDHKEQALLTLSILHNEIKEYEKGANYFMDFYEISSNPIPEVFALWYNESVVGGSGLLNNHQLNLFQKLYSSTNTKGLLDGALDYNYGTHYMFKNDKKKSDIYYNKINNLNKWSVLGPFDNIVNNGFDKNFGALDTNKREFLSVYGTKVKWETPIDSYNDGYFISNRYFVNSNALIYAQSFVKLEEEKEVYLKLGYSGVLKLWVNDSLIYAEPSKRTTEMDYFQFKLTLNQGHNRVLVQLGEFDDNTYTNFSVRITDSNHNVLNLSQSETVKPYKKGIKNLSVLKFNTITKLEEKLKNTGNENELLYKLLLAKTYIRSSEYDEAEQILNDLYNKYPKNYLLLRLLVNFHQASGKGTLQNKYYEEFKELYPHDRDILSNEINKLIKEKKIEESNKNIGIFKELYPSAKRDLMAFDLSIASLNEDYEKLIKIINQMYVLFPDDKDVVNGKYQVEKSLNPDSKSAIKILETYLKSTYNYSVLSNLIDELENIGDNRKLIQYLNHSSDLTIFDSWSLKKLANIYLKSEDYDKAISYYNKILQNRPSDYYTMDDIGQLYQIKGDNNSALKYYEKSLQYYPFSFTTNEKIRVIKGKTSMLSLVEELKVDEVIKEFKENFKPSKTNDYDIVFETEYRLVFESEANGRVYSYMLRLNNEDALKDWQKIDLSSSRGYNLNINEAKVIKSSGAKIDAERNYQNVVFTNLEVGDYIYIKYTEKQYSGGKSSKFFSDYFSFNSYSPCYKTKYCLITEGNYQITDTMVNLAIEPKITKENDFTKYVWESINPKIIKDEPQNIPFNDVSNRLHISAKYAWNDIVNWYDDLSRDQAKVDYTIKEITKSLFEDGKTYTDIEKAKIIYEFLLKNIQYSSIDFRQSNFIPQKASDVYITRLGDCKDISTLYAAIGRNAGLDVDLVLISTSDNGKNNVILPSINFNHCIVKVNIKNNPLYLELTNPNLPFGHLNYYHKYAPILEIPYNKPANYTATLKHLDFNKGYTSSIIRDINVEIKSNGGINIVSHSIKTGRKVTGFINDYYNKDTLDQINTLKNSLSSDFKSLIKINYIKLTDAKPRKDTIVYDYSYSLENEVIKIGSLNSIKIPFADVIIKSDLFEHEERENPFYYSKYEDNEYYNQTTIIKSPTGTKIIEIPENKEISLGKFKYSLVFQSISDSELKVERSFIADIRNILPKEFNEFKEFMLKVIEAENTHIVYK